MNTNRSVALTCLTLCILLPSLAAAQTPGGERRKPGIFERLRRAPPARDTPAETRGNDSNRSIVACGSPLVDSKSDRFTDTTSVRSKPVTLGSGEDRLEFVAYYEPREQVQDDIFPTNISFKFVSKSKRRFERNPVIAVIVDGKRERPLPASAGIDRVALLTGSGPLSTTIRSGADLEVVERIARGKQVEMKVGDVELVLGQDALDALRAVAGCTRQVDRRGKRR